MARRTIKPETDKDTADLLVAHDQLKDVRLPFEETWKEIAKYEHPRINNFDSDTDQGTKRTDYILDSAPLRSIRVASDGYQSYLFPRSMPWFKFAVDNAEVMKSQKIAMYFRDIERSVLGDLERSTFYNEGGMVVDNGLTIGTSVCYAEPDEDNRTTNFLSLHPKECYISRNKFGVVDTMHRRFLMQGRNILDKFSKDGLEKKLKAEQIKRFEENPYTFYPVIHITIPRTDAIAKRIMSVKKPWASIYLLEDEQIIIRNSGFDEFPFMVWCPRLNTDEDYGRSPGWDGLSDVKRLQKAVKTIMQSSELQAKPPKFIPQELEGSEDFTPDGRNYYRDFSRKITPVETALNLQHLEMIAEQIRRTIDDHFDVPFFLAFRNQQSQKTATEVAEIAGERAALMGTTTGRIENDFLDPALYLTLRNAARAGRLPQPPSEIRKYLNDDFKINYTGPLATLQKRYHGQQNINSTFMQAVPFLQVFPEARFQVNAKGAVRTLLIEGGMVPEGINTEEEAEKQEQAFAAAQAEAANAEKLEKLGKAGPGIAQMAQGPMGEAMSQLTG